MLCYVKAVARMLDKNATLAKLDLQDQRLLSSTLSALEATRSERAAPLELLVEVSRLSRNSRGSKRHDSESI